MRKIREVLRLRWGCNQSERAVAAACGISRGAVGNYLERAERAGLSWPLPDSVSDDAIEALLYPTAPPYPAERSVPDYPKLHEELKRKGVTLALLWEEYQQGKSRAYCYSQFCALYQTYAGTLSPSMRMVHRAGEKLFVDYAGQTVAVVNRETGQVRQAQVFVAVLGASLYTYAEATWSQTLPDWIGSHVRALSFLGGVPLAIVPDNLRSAVSSACRYEPDINPTYQEFAEHYGLAILPARVRKPKDKARAEAGVLLVERWLLACLRHQTFFGLDELNAAISQLLERLNDKPFKKLPGSRRSQFEALDQPELRPLPAQRYTFAEWQKVRVQLDYHVEVLGHAYSVPYQMIHKQLEVRLTGSTLECYFKGRRVASHLRSEKQGGATTVREHMPTNHQQYLDWTPEKLQEQALTVGPGCQTAVENILREQVHVHQGQRSCVGLLGLMKRYGAVRLEAACARAVTLNTCTYKSVKSVLEKGLDRQRLPAPAASAAELKHENVRGSAYYHC